MFKTIVSILIIAICGMFLYNFLFHNDGPLEKQPTETPYVYQGILYTSIKEIPIEYITYVELVGGTAVPFIAIHYQYPDSKYHTGTMTMSKVDYLKFRSSILRYNIIEIIN